MPRSTSDSSFLLPRLLSKWGVCSRKEAEHRVVAGRVAVNGAVRRDVMTKVATTDRIEVDGMTVGPAAKIYLKMNKPRGVVTTVRDERGRRCVSDLLPATWRGAMPVGRLDRESSGLLLLTNDHALGDAVTAGDGPEKLYRVVVDGHPDDAVFAPMRRGVVLDGRACLPARVSVVARRDRTTVLEVGLREGRNRQIRRSLAEVDLEVRSLVRVAIGPIRLDDLPPGSVMPLSEAELAELRDAYRAPDGGGL